MISAASEAKLSLPEGCFSVVQGSHASCSIIQVGCRLSDVADLAAPLYTVDEYFSLVERGVLQGEDRVELLEGVIVAVSPQSPSHSVAIRHAEEALRRAFAGRGDIRVQMPFLAGSRSGPEPDVAVVPGAVDDYAAAHPHEALLVVEVADATLLQDRLTKARIYAAAAVPEYWIVNLVDRVVEVHRLPDQVGRHYVEAETLAIGDLIEPVGAPGASVTVSELLPPL